MDESGRPADVHSTMVNFRIIYMIQHMVGLALIVLMCSWVSLFLGGVSTTDPKTEFNWHPILMTIGMVYMYGNSIILYRGLRYARKKNLKVSHATLFGCIFVLAILALIAVFDSHNYASPKPIPNLYSLHSWIGLAAVILFGLQWVGGFVSFLYPQLRGSMRASVMPYHIYFGFLGYMLAVVAALMGLAEKASFHITNISELPAEALLVNAIGALIILFAALIGFLVSTSEFKRQALPEDEMLLTGGDE